MTCQRCILCMGKNYYHSVKDVVNSCKQVNYLDMFVIILNKSYDIVKSVMIHKKIKQDI